MSGGEQNQAINWASWVGGGFKNKAQGALSSVFGGKELTALGEFEAIGRANSSTRPELTDTILVTYGSQVLPQALAHELVHLLSDSGDHSTEAGNLMRYELGPEDTSLTQAQCERIRSRGEANGLLKKR